MKLIAITLCYLGLFLVSGLMGGLLWELATGVPLPCEVPGARAALWYPAVFILIVNAGTASTMTWVSWRYLGGE